MPISEKEYFEALRAADQRALELLAKSNADRVKISILTCSLIVAIAGVMVAVAALVLRH